MAKSRYSKCDVLANLSAEHNRLSVYRLLTMDALALILKEVAKCLQFKKTQKLPTVTA